MGFHIQQFYKHKYRGIFSSEFEYDLASNQRDLAELRKNEGNSLDEEQIDACARLEKLEELGGIREWPSGPLSDEDSNSLIEIFQNYRESHA